MATRRTRGDNGRKFMEDLEIRIKSRKPIDRPPIRDQAAQRQANLERGYPKKFVRTGTVDLGAENVMGGNDLGTGRNMMITNNPVAGVDADAFLDPYINALGNALGNPGAPRLPYTELNIPRPSRTRKRKG